jgi:hypothetical protein
MKNIKPLILLMLFGMLSFAQTASGQLQADDTRDSTRLAFSPYAQAVPNDSYTFMGISHPSLDTALTQIGVVLEVIGMTTTTNNAAGRAAVFTVDAGETHRIFVVNQSHATINASNAAFDNAQDSRVHLIPTVDSAQFGSVRVTTTSATPTTAVTVNSVDKYANLAQLNIWGVVFVEAAGTGFAMEFVGDMQDSTLGGNISSAGRVSGVAPAGRGIN